MALLSATLVVGVDLRRDGGRTVRADAVRLPLAAEAFDAVTCLNMYPGDTRGAFVPELARVLRRGGTLAMTIHNHAHPALWVRRLVHLVIRGDAVYRLYSPWAVVERLGREGIDVVETIAISIKPGPAPMWGIVGVRR